MSDGKMPAKWTVWVILRGLHAVALRQCSSEHEARTALAACREALEADDEIVAAGLMAPGSSVMPCAASGPVKELDVGDMRRIHTIMARHGL